MRAQAGGPVMQAQRNEITWAALAKLSIPIQLVTGDADLFWPPSLMRLVAEHLQWPAWRTHVIREAGHNPHWEQPHAWNSVLLNFLREVRVT